MYIYMSYVLFMIDFINVSVIVPSRAAARGQVPRLQRLQRLQRRARARCRHRGAGELGAAGAAGAAGCRGVQLVETQQIPSMRFYQIL